MATASGPDQDQEVYDRDAVRDAWLGRLGALVEDVKRWAEESDWSTRVISKTMEDHEIGDYRAPALLLQKETVRILLDPIGRSAPGVEGIVDLYLMPAYDDIARLYFADGTWRLDYAFGPPASDTAEAEEDRSVVVGREAVVRVLDALSRHAA